jgi:hypothetical protein
VPYERPTTDQINFTWDSSKPPVLPLALTIPLAKKVLDDLPTENGKDLAPGDAQERAAGKPNVGRSRILRDARRPGGG